MPASSLRKLPYTSGFWVGKHVVLPFAEGVFDATNAGIRPRFERELRQALSDAIPDWFERLLKLKLV